LASPRGEKRELAAMGGLQGEALKHYYRSKPAHWAICRDKPGMEAAWRTL
jgi:hypothetical protein